MKLIFMILVLATLISVGAHGHDGHNHGPGQIQPSKGGVIMKNDKFFLEVVGDNNSVKFYPLKQENAKSQTLKPIPLNEFKMTATYKLPRAKKADAISVKPAGDHYAGVIDAKKSHRYEVEVKVEYQGEKEEITYQIEPQE